jgi:hypothetical protein
MEGGMLTGTGMLVAAFGIFILMWIIILVGSRGFGSPPEH